MTSETTTPSDPAGGGRSSKTSTLASHLSKANSVASESLRRTLARHRRAATADDDDGRGGRSGGGGGDDGRKRRDVAGDGEGIVVDYLRVKNAMTISYLVDLTMLLRHRLSPSPSSPPPPPPTEDGDGAGEGRREEMRRRQAHQQQRRRRRHECLDRLLEMKVALERMRPLEKKMRYQIDKLLALSTLGGGAGTFAAMGREEEVANDKDETTKIADDGVDPLSFKPDLEGMMKMFVEEEEEDGNNGPNGADSKYEGSDDDDESNVDGGGGKSSSYKARIALEKDDNDPQPNDGRSNVYQPPRLQSMPFDIDDNERAMQKRRRQLEKQRDRLSRSELTAVMRSQFTDAPEEEDARGGALLGMQSESARRIAARDADVREFEERQMIRLTMGKKERGERKRMMREEMSNLGAIAGGLGSLMVGVDDAFGGGGGTRRRDGEARDGRGSGADNDGAGGPFKTVGMRKRRVDVLEGGDGSKKRKKKKGGATNTYQKSLYGDGGGGGGGGMSKKKK